MLKSPPYLKAGDKVAIIAPASKVDFNDLLIGINLLESWGLDVIIGKNVGQSFNNFSANDFSRKIEFQNYLDDPEINLIIGARGGYGCSKYIDDLNFDTFKQWPKWICGFSDLTIILSQLFQLGFQSIHGPMVKTMSFDAESNDYLKNILFGIPHKYNFKSNPSNRSGHSQGMVIGGNLVLLTHAIGTQSDVDYDNKILFIEDIGEYYYNIDRMLVQLKRANKLKNLAGLVVGNFSDCKNTETPFGKNIEEIVLDHVDSFNFPIAFDFPFGHDNKNFVIKIGETINFRVTSNQVTIETANYVI